MPRNNRRPSAKKTKHVTGWPVAATTSTGRVGSYEAIARDLVRRGLASAGVLESPLIETRAPKFVHPNHIDRKEDQ